MQEKEVLQKESISELVKNFLEKGIVLEKEVLEIIVKEKVEPSDIRRVEELAEKRILTKDALIKILKKPEEKKAHPLRIYKEKSEEEKKPLEPQAYPQTYTLTIEKSYEKDINEKKLKTDVNSFVEMFRYRYEKLKNILLSRPELRNCISAGRLGKNGFSGATKGIAVVGLVTNVLKAKSANTIIELEDPTGKVTVLVKEEKDLEQQKVLCDEMIGVRGSFSRGYFFPENIVWPDVPLPQGVAKLSSEEKDQEKALAVFISDLHIGSKYYIKEIEERFLNWIKSPAARAVKWLFIAGDLVDGVGIYPKQDKELTIKDLAAQYHAFEEFVLKIPRHIQIVVCPGNHDGVRSSEPQPAFDRSLLPTISQMPNVYLVSNPAYLRISEANSPNSSNPVSILMYHGTSFLPIIDTLPYLRRKGTNHPELVIREILRRRHLAPLYGSTPICPEPQDWLLIEKVPDIFHTGHMHAHCAENYKGITIINSSTFQAQTPYMDRMGAVANPGKVTIIDLTTRAVAVKDFAS